MKKTIAVLPGDGIGPEVMEQAIKVLNKIAEKYQHEFSLLHADIGGVAFEKHTEHFPIQTAQICKNADAVLFGSVGGPVSEAHLSKWKNCERHSILALRKTLNLSSNLRPTRVYPELADSCPLKNELIQDGLDILIVRELLGDIYFGKQTRWEMLNSRYASDVAEYNEHQIRDVVERGFQLARIRGKKLTSVDKANVLETSKLWREIAMEVAKNYKDVYFENMLVDNCAMQLIINPKQFDVIVTSNLFGDILSDAAAALPGSLGLMPSASLNTSTFGLYEPSGGSAPDIAGKDIANPIAQILSVAMMLRYSFNLEKESVSIENAVHKTLQQGYRTRDIFTGKNNLVGTRKITHMILQNIS